MSNPITGAFIEAQDRKTADKSHQEESSKKMGLEVIGSTAQAFAEAIFDSAIQTPANGVMQLFNPQEAKALKVVNNKQQEINSAEWYAQLAGTGAGSLLNFIGLSKALKGAGESIKFAGAATTSKFWRPLANTVSLVEKSALCQKPMLSAAATGAFYGGVLTPVDPHGEDMGMARLKNAGIGAVTVAAMITPNQLRLRANSLKPTESGNSFHQAVALALGGPLAGIVHAEASCLAQGKLAPDIDGREFKESMLAYSILGVGYAGYHGLAKAEKPVELEDIEATSKLRETRRPEALGPKRTREETGRLTVEWNNFVDEFNQYIRKEINKSSLSGVEKVELIERHRKGLNDILSQPANIGNLTPYKKHLDTMMNALEGTETKPFYPQLPATHEQVQQKSNLPAKVDQLSQTEGQLPDYDGESMSLRQLTAPKEPSPADLVPQATGLTNSEIGRKVNSQQQSMAQAKRANVNTTRQQRDLADTIYQNRGTDGKKARGLSFRATTFEKKGYTAEQNNKKALVDRITASSNETAAGIGSPEELQQKTKFKRWNGTEEP